MGDDENASYAASRGSVLPDPTTIHWVQQLLYWLGVVLAVLGCVGLIIGGSVKLSFLHTTPNWRIAMWGGGLLVCVILAVIGGATATPDGKLSPPTIGAKFTGINAGYWIAIAVIMVIMILLTILIKK